MTHLEALAEAGGVIAETTAGAIAAEVVALAEEDVRARGALLEGAVRATGTKVADAANVLEGVPGLGVGLRGLVGELLLLDAAATAIAVGGAHGAHASLAVVAVEALALPRRTALPPTQGATSYGVFVVRSQSRGTGGATGVPWAAAGVMGSHIGAWRT